MSDFLKKAYEAGKVKSLEEAFKEFPVEEEWHKGDANNYIREKDEKYHKSYNVGDIVFVKEYKYENGNVGKDHLFVLIDKNNTAVPIENFGLIISSNLNKLRFSTNKLLRKDKSNNLKRDSIVKTDVMYILLDEQILFKIGIVDKEKVENYKSSFIANLNKD